MDNIDNFGKEKIVLNIVHVHVYDYCLLYRAPVSRDTINEKL